MPLNETHDPALKSWVASANAPEHDFPIQNLPFGIVRRRGSSEKFGAAVAIGDEALDLARAHAAGLFDGLAVQAALACGGDSLNALMALGAAHWSALRLSLSRQLHEGSASQQRLRECLVPLKSIEHKVPAAIGDFTDFYASIHHATAVGRLIRPDNPLMPNYKWLPIAYHGRSSSIGVSGQAFHRPLGQIKPAQASAPTFGAARRLDYELELGVYVGPGNALGAPIALEDAEGHVFGLCLLNDWSARDIQVWEYQPLGPFLAKNFATTVSPWIVTLEALAPYRAAWERAPADPQPLPYLESQANRASGAIDIQIEAWLQSEAMRRAGHSAMRLSHASFRHSYWTLFQLVAHHSCNGCNLRPGDLLGTGTQSGPTPPEAGSLIELTAGGTRPLNLPSGEQRAFLEDGDTVTLRGYCARRGAARIGFGECAGTVLPALVA